MADWQNLEVDLSGVQAGVDGTQAVSDAVSAVGQIASALLGLLRTFTVPSLPNPIAGATMLLIAQLEDLLESLGDTGAFGLFLLPTTLDDLADSAGGYARFEQRVVASFYDTADAERPQVGQAGTLGGLVIYVNAPSPAGIIEKALALARLFGQRPEVSYPSPISLRATPASDLGVAIPGVIDIYTQGIDPPTTILLEWEEPKSTQNIFFDLFAANKFYIERSRSREGKRLTVTQPSTIQIDPLARRRNAPPEYREPVLDEKGAVTTVWEPLDPSNPFLDADDADEGEGRLGANFLAGTYSTVLRGLTPGQDEGYYYRIRSVPENTVLASRPVETTDAGGVTAQEIAYELKLDGKPYQGSPPSSPVYGFIPEIPKQTGGAAFDLPTALLNVYRAAYLLRFDTTVFDDSSQPLTGSGILNPITPQTILDLPPDDFDFDGTGSVSAAFESQSPGGFRSTEDGVRYFSGEFFPEVFFEQGPPGYADSKRNVATLGAITSSSALEDDPFAGARELFAAKLGLTVRERYRLYVDEVATDKIERILPLIARNETLLGAIRTSYVGFEADLLELLTGFTTDFTLIEREDLRIAVASLMVLFDGQIRPGQPPNWRSVRLFKDVLPEVDRVGAELLAAIQSIELATADVSTRLDATVEGLQNRLAALDAVVDALDEIISFLDAVSGTALTASILFIPPQTGGAPAFVNEVLAAQDKPTSEPTDYGGGFVLAAGGAGPGDGAALFDALRFVFGF